MATLNSGNEEAFRASQASFQVLDGANDPSKAAPALGSYAYDLSRGKYTLQWASEDELDQWIKQEEKSNSIELRYARSYSPNRGVREQWSNKRVFVCGRNHTGGKKKYEKKHPDRISRHESKKINCPVRLTVKNYHGTKCLLGLYSEEHNHELGIANVRHTRVPDETRERIAGMLRQGMDSNTVVRY